jgi:UDP-N-acetylmuramoyl-L-alanyl-D-glutamate--2,6-diaminopimelate ligase
MHRDLTVDQAAVNLQGRVIGDGSVTIDNVEHDSRRVTAGTLFVAIRGFEADGHRYVEGAIANGAAAVCVDHPMDVAIPQVIVEDTRLALGPVSSLVRDHPSRRLAVVGITGTNGKTTVTHLLESIGKAAGMSAAVVGTIGARVDGMRIPLERTTPEASELQDLFAEMVDRSVDFAAMEVSSHSLALHRVDGTRFKVAGFTNLSQDHLDFHKDMDTYFAAKAQLFTSDTTEQAVIFVDDPYGERLAASVDVPVTRVGFESHANVRAESVHVFTTHSTFTVRTPDDAFPVTLGLGGTFNVANALVATGCALALGIERNHIVAGLASVHPVTGRFELVDARSPIAVIVDYAHTPDGIRAALESARATTEGRVIAVLGAGGDRDHSKREAMGAAASSADVVIVTSDNPRSEDPLTIARAVRSGVTSSDVVIEIDRREAIFEAVRRAEAGDAVMILGKGHETTQAFKDRVVHFDDREVARQALEEHL